LFEKRYAKTYHNCYASGVLAPPPMYSTAGLWARGLISFSLGSRARLDLGDPEVAGSKSIEA